MEYYGILWNTIEYFGILWNRVWHARLVQYAYSLDIGRRHTLCKNLTYFGCMYFEKY